jgi:hypothetical protein
MPTGSWCSHAGGRSTIPERLFLSRTVQPSTRVATTASPMRSTMPGSPPLRSIIGARTNRRGDRRQCHGLGRRQSRHRRPARAANRCTFRPSATCRSCCSGTRWAHRSRPPTWPATQAVSPEASSAEYRSTHGSILLKGWSLTEALAVRRAHGAALGRLDALVFTRRDRGEQRRRPGQRLPGPRRPRRHPQPQAQPGRSGRPGPSRGTTPHGRTGRAHQRGARDRRADPRGGRRLKRPLGLAQSWARVSPIFTQLESAVALHYFAGRAGFNQERAGAVAGRAACRERRGAHGKRQLLGEGVQGGHATPAYRRQRPASRHQRPLR